MRPTRRDMLRAGLYGGAALAAGPVFFPSRWAYGVARPIDTRRTTLAGTVRRGPELADRHGYRLMVAGPAEPHLVRGDLGVAARSGRANRRLPVIAFVHYTDTHMLDAQSPARVEFLDRYPPAFSAAFRPQETLTTQITDAMVRTTNAIARGPVSGRALEFTMCTGDNIDNAQFNEQRWFIDLLDGRAVRPDSGDPAKYEGIQDQESSTYDIHYWHPDGTPPGKVDDNPRTLFGYPVVPGLLEAARRPFVAAGLDMPWFAAFGNHDPLLQGNVGPNPAFTAIAVGGTKVVSLPGNVSPDDVANSFQQGDPAVLQAMLTVPGRPVTPDANRRPLERPEIMAEFFRTSGRPVGHGFTAANIDSGRGYYARDHGKHIRIVVLDTVNYGSNNGSIDADQLLWLQQELLAHSTTRIGAGGSLEPTGGSVDRLIIVFSHHSIETMDNPVLGPGETQPRVLGPVVRDELLRWPNCVLWVNGHRHENHITGYRRASGSGFWDINTAAHIDWPHQSRIIEIVDNLDSTLSIFVTTYEPEAPLSFGGKLDSTVALTSLARELSANDWQTRGASTPAERDGARGLVGDRNAELLVLAPFELKLDQASSATPVQRPNTGPRETPATGAASTPAAVAAGLAVAAAGIAAARRRALSGERDDVGVAEC